MLERQLKPGDLVFYYRLTLRQAGAHNLVAWLCGWITSLAQWFAGGGPQGTYSGSHDLVHVGVCVTWQGALHVLDWAPGGMRLHPLDLWLRLSVHRRVVVPLSERYSELVDEAAVCRWIDAHRHYSYNWLGLPRAVLRRALGRPAPGEFFCSEAVMTLLRDLGVVPRELAVLRRGHVAWGEILPQAWSPADVAELPQLARCGMVELEVK